MTSLGCTTFRVAKCCECLYPPCRTGQRYLMICEYGAGLNTKSEHEPSLKLEGFSSPRYTTLSEQLRGVESNINTSFKLIP